MDSLLSQAKSGDEKAQEQFFAEYKPLVRKVCGQYFLLGADRDDILQEGMIGLYNALRAYNETKNTNFKTFATVCIRRQVLNAIKKYSNNKHKPLNESGTVFEKEGELLDVASNEPDALEQVLEQEKLDELFQFIQYYLSEKEREVLEEHLQGKSQSQIATALRVLPKSVDNTLTRIKQKLKVWHNNKPSI